MDSSKRDTIKNQRKSIKAQLFEKFKVRVDRVTPQGVGNFGDEARRFFAAKNHKDIAKLLQVPYKLLMYFNHIRIAIATNQMFNVNSFKSLCIVTFNLIRTTYPWMFLSPTLHRVLCHAIHVQIVLGAPIGRFSEEQIEAYNLLVKRVLINHTYKGDATAALEDLHYWLMGAGDLVISQLRDFQTKQNMKPPAQMSYVYKEPLVKNPQHKVKKAKKRRRISDLKSTA